MKLEAAQTDSALSKKPTERHLSIFNKRALQVLRLGSETVPRASTCQKAKRETASESGLTAVCPDMLSQAGPSFLRIIVTACPDLEPEANAYSQRAT